jgi:pimeloyl-ACP methyl ester carboxylesterase
MIDGTTTNRIGRREMLAGTAGAAAAGIATRLGSPATSAAQDGRSTYVLVHGYWAGAWIWRDVIAGMQAAGHRVYATTATGMGDRVHLADPAINLDVFITDVVNVLEFEDLRDVILAGWSYGGMIISGVAERVPERLAQVVYLDAVVAANGESFYDAALIPKEVLAPVFWAGEAVGIPGFEPVDEGFIRAWTKDPAVADWLMAKLTPQPIATTTQPLEMGNPAAAALPHVYLNCLEGKDDPTWAFTVRAVERAKSEPGWRVVDLAENHMAPVNDPQLTVETLLSLV